MQTFDIIVEVKTFGNINCKIFHLRPALCVVLITFSLCYFVCYDTVFLPPSLESCTENPMDEEHVRFDWLAAN